MEEQQSINQSSTLYLVQNENLEKLLDRNQELKNEVEATEELINAYLEIKTMQEFYLIVEKICKLKLNIKKKKKGNNLTCVIKKMQEATKQQDIEQYLNEIKFYHYDTVLRVFFMDKILKAANAKEDTDINEFNFSRITNILLSMNMKQISNNILNGNYGSIWKHVVDFDEDYNCADNLRNVLAMIYNEYFVGLSSKKLMRDFVTNPKLIPLLKYKNGFYFNLVCQIMILNIYVSTPEILLVLLSNKDRYNFFLQFHKILEENLSQEDKPLFYDYLTSCREKLQDKKSNYKIFNKPVRNLTGILIFGIIASATVLTINLLEIYAAIWFFWFGIVGVVLTIAVGIRLFLCIKENWNDLKKLKSDLKGENKTIEQKINEIDRAIEVYDLNKIKNLKKQELEIISMLSVNKNNKKTEEINTDKTNGGRIPLVESKSNVTMSNDEKI